MNNTYVSLLASKKVIDIFLEDPGIVEILREALRTNPDYNKVLLETFEIESLVRDIVQLTIPGLTLLAQDPKNDKLIEDVQDQTKEVALKELLTYARVATLKALKS